MDVCVLGCLHISLVLLQVVQVLANARLLHLAVVRGLLDLRRVLHHVQVLSTIRLVQLRSLGLW